MSQKSGSSAGCLWVKVSHEVAVKLLTGAMVSFESSVKSEGIYLPAHSCGSWQALVSDYIGLYAGLPYDMAAGFPQGE